ncbi:MAG: SpoIIE family protein phosphatase [bacterium]|nr:SpoIIE family protein phosphatase [bacterium]
MQLSDFLLSFHSVGLVTPALMSTLLALYMWSRARSRQSFFLALAFTFYTTMFVGFFLAYSVFHEIGAFHRYLTVTVVFAQTAMIVFAYNYPRNDHPRESVVVIVAYLLSSIAAYAQFVYEASQLSPYFDFAAHMYNFQAGRVMSLVILAQLLWLAIVFTRKTIRSDEYTGPLAQWIQRPPSLLSPRIFPFLGARFLTAPLILARPRGRAAKATRGFVLVCLFFLVIGVTNVLAKSETISYDLFASIYSALSLISVFVLFMSYINNSPEPTTFMVKIVGISLVTLLLVLGGVSTITLTLSERSYDSERSAAVDSSRAAILAGDFSSLPQNMDYVLTREDRPGLFPDDAAILWQRPDSALSPEGLARGIDIEKSARVAHEIELLKRKRKDLTTPEALEAAALEIIDNKTLPVMERLYRNGGDAKYIHFDFVEDGQRYEVGFRYRAYREYTHATGIMLFASILGASLAILLFFPMLFGASLVKPLTDLLDGVKKVNDGDFDVTVPIKVQDEIGYLAGSFNSMVTSIRDARAKLQDYAENLEEKVEIRTREVREKMEEVQRLKVQQDGDYFLTSLLARPLFFNANKSKAVATDFLIKQKKRFEFRQKEGDLGGDICVTGNLKFGTPDNFERYTMGMNGDAMGKSMQGAGGSLVMGVVMNSIMARSAANKRVLDMTPEQWLTELYDEIHGVFKTFDGTMVISAVVYLVNDATGMVHYFNAEHPASVLYRNGKASFIEEGLTLRKLGHDSEFKFEVFQFQLQPGDVILMGSDGRDDVNLTPGAETRTINEDEFVFLEIVNEVGPDLDKIEEKVRALGEITDDLSLLRMGYREAVGAAGAGQQHHPETMIASGESGDIEALLDQGKQLYLEGKLKAAISVLNEAYQIDQAHMKLNKLLGLLSFKGQDYERAVEVLRKYLNEEPTSPEFWIYLSLAEKKRGNYDEAMKAAEYLQGIEPKNVKNLINLADLHRLTGKSAEAEKFAREAHDLDPEDRDVLRFLKLIA